MLSFVQAADRGSFAAAARHLRLTPAAVGKNIGLLEASLGVRLMNRTTRSLQLTVEGEIFLSKARAALDAIDTAVESMSSQRSEPAGKLRISTSSGFGRHFLLPLLPGLLARYPAIVPEIAFDDHPIDLVREGFDIAFRGGSIQDSSLISRRICSMKMVLVASPDYLERNGIPATPTDLPSHRLIATQFLDGHAGRWELVTPERKVEEFIPASPALVASDPEAAVIIAASGLGIAQAGLHYAWPYLRSGQLKVVLAGYLDSGSREMVLLYPHRALIAARVRATVDFLAQGLAKMEALRVGLGDVGAYVV
ncbi:LysR family transcriptional regulator [Labrys neptuniae]